MTFYELMPMCSRANTPVYNRVSAVRGLPEPFYLDIQIVVIHSVIWRASSGILGVERVCSLVTIDGSFQRWKSLEGRIRRWA